MAISRIKVSNFKSFDELDLELRPLNVVVGSNAAGKSNFLEIFRFLRDVAEHGLADAVSRQGGMEFLYRRGGTGPLRLEVEFDDARSQYFLELQPRGYGYEVSGERLFTAFKNQGSAELLRQGDRLEVRPHEQQLLLELLTEGDFVLGSSESFLARTSMGPRTLKEIAFFDFDPKLPKLMVPVSGSSQLEPAGGNLAVVLRNLQQDPESSEDFLLLVQGALPFVKDVQVVRTGRHLLLSIQELYTPAYLPAAFLSDGTIQVIALILALFFRRADLVLVEEPERNIHPHLISRVVSMMKDAARSRQQVIATTHNPELVKHVELDDLLLVHRDDQGRSRILRPAESQEVQIFLEGDLGVEDLYVQNLLSFGHAV